MSAPAQDADRSAALRGRWQARTFSAVWITYFAYYLCRYNMPVAKTRMCETFSWDAEQFGIVFTALTVAYAVGQFVNGQLGDRYGTRVVSTVGALGSVLTNLAVFAVILLAAPSPEGGDRIFPYIVGFWGLNGFFQAMGWSPMVRVMAQWFPAARRGKTMGLVGTSYQLGAAAAVLLATFLTGYWVTDLSGDWRMAFLVPSVVLAAIGLWFFLTIRDEPADVGLPPVDRAPDSSGSREGEGGERRRRTVAENVAATLTNPRIWVVAGAFFMLDVNRYGFVNWMPDFIDAQGGAAAGLAANFRKVMKLAIHPLAGAAGAVLAGWATDRFFNGRRAPVIAALLALLGGFSCLFAYIPQDSTLLVVAVVAAVGFCTYGPHILMVGHAAQDFGGREGSAGAAGFIDGMGYIGASLAGWGAGALIQAQGHAFTFRVFGLAAFVGAGLACLIWREGPGTRSDPEADGESAGER